MDLQLSGKRALVTGSSSGIGENIAKTLAQEGVIVAIHGRREEQANNAGMFHDRGWMDTPAQEWSKIYNINVVSLVRMVQLFVPIMKQLGWGRLIQIGTALATQPFAIRADYTATKAAILNLTVSLAKELANTGITVEDMANCVTYLARPLSGYINSTNIRVDGGGVGVVS